MSSKLNQQTLLAFLVFISFLHFPKPSSSETECPYPPCSPSPPTGSETAGTLSPPLLTGGSIYPPPAPGDFIPNSPTPPDHVSSVALPTPDSVVPWYPYYSKRPVTHQSSSTSLATRTVVIGSPILLVFLFFLSTFAHAFLYTPK